MVLSMNLELKRFLCFWAVIYMHHSYMNINLFCHTLKNWDWEIKTLPIVFIYKTGLFHIGGVLFHGATEGIAKAWSSDPGAGRTPRCFHAYYFHPLCGDSPAHTHFARLPGVGATDRRGNTDNVRGKKRKNKHIPCPAWICFLLWRDFKEVQWFVSLGILETCTGEKGHTYSTLQSCKSSFPWSSPPQNHPFWLRASPVCKPPQPSWRGGQRRNLCFWDWTRALLFGINTLARAEASWLFRGASC